MAASVFKYLSALFSAVVLIGGVTALPTSNSNSLAKRATVPAAPRFVIYSDKWVSGETGPPNVTDITGYNVL